MEISTLFMARVQFALSLNFLVLFAALAMAFGWVLLFLRWRSVRSTNPAWMGAYRFWVRVFALALIMAVGGAVPVLFELGILWPSLLERIGNVAGPLLAAGIATFFVIKAVFMGVMLFGQKRVSPAGHLFSIAMVAMGMTLTVFWGIVLQAWTHTPDGATLIDGRYQVFDWFEVVFNAALGWHCLMFCAGAGLVAGFVMIGVPAWQATRRPLEDGERTSFQTGFWLVILSLAMLAYATDGTARLVARYQPAAAAAVMGYWEGSLVTDTASARWLGRAADGTLIGLDGAAAHSPPARMIYWLARLALAVAVGMVCLMISLAWFRWQRGRDPSVYPAALLRITAWFAGSGAIVWLSLWNLVELGRAPYLVWGVLTQKDLVTDADGAILAIGVLSLLGCYLLLGAGFVGMLAHAARFGVVPVRKPGRHA